MITKMSASSMNAKTWYRSMLAGNDAFSPGAYELIETTVLGSSAASVTFTSGGAWASYKHLQLRVVARGTSTDTAQVASVRFNSDSGSNYSWHRLQGAGGSVGSAGVSGQPQMSSGFFSDNGSTSSAFGADIVDILDFSNTSKNTTIRSLSGSAVNTMAVALKSGAWYSTAAVTSIYYAPSYGDWASGSRFSLYGIVG